jgi:hypothetical protein
MTNRCEPPPELRGVKWFDNAHIMGMWDNWRRYIAEGGGASWPRDAFESLLDAHDAEVEALRAERDTLRARVARLEQALEEIADARNGSASAARAALSAETP